MTVLTPLLDSSPNWSVLNPRTNDSKLLKGLITNISPVWGSARTFDQMRKKLILPNIGYYNLKINNVNKKNTMGTKMDIRNLLKIKIKIYAHFNSNQL